MSEVYLESKKVILIGYLISIPIAAFYIFEIERNWNKIYKFEMSQIKDLVLIFNNKLLNSFIVFLLPILIMVLGVIIHELIHAFFMAYYSKNNFKSVRFGFDLKHFMPFANCSEPLLPSKMLIITMAPFFFLGVLPTLYGFYFKDIILLFFGFSMVLGAAGDFIYAFLIITKVKNKKNKILDHKTKIGFIIID